MANREYTLDEYNDMLRILHQSDNDAELASIRYAAVFEDERERFPGKKVFINLRKRVATSGSVAPLNKYVNKGRKYEATPELEFEIITTFQENPEATSIRKVAAILGENYSRVQRILKKYGFFAYHYRKVQLLIVERDLLSRLAFSNTITLHIRANENYAIRILWTDECKFTNDGMFNTKNTVYWSDNGNPHAVKEANDQRRWSINVWCGVIYDRIVSIQIIFHKQIFIFLIHNFSTN